MMNRFLLLAMLVGIGFNTLSVKADPVSHNTTGNAVDMAYKQALPPNKEHGTPGIPKDVPVGNFDTPDIRDFRQMPSIKLNNVRGKLIQDIPEKQAQSGKNEKVEQLLEKPVQLEKDQPTDLSGHSVWQVPEEHYSSTQPAVGDFGSPEGTKKLPDALKDKKPIGDFGYPSEIPRPNQ